MSRLSPDHNLQRKPVKRSFILLAVVLIISLLSFLGRVFSIEALNYPINGTVAMNQLTAICFIMPVIAFRNKLKDKDKKNKHAIADIVAVFVFVIAFSKLIAIVVGWNSLLDQLMLANEIGNSTVGEAATLMSPNTAFCFSLLAAGILFFYKLQRLYMFVTQAASVLVLMLALISILDETDPNWPKFFEAGNIYGKAQGELMHFRKDGSAFLVEITSVKFKTAAGDEQTNTIIRDITERKRAEEELNESYQQIRRLTAYLQKVREEERANIARDIHDELGQQLTVMKMDISWMKKKIIAGEVGAVPEKMNELQKILDSTVASVRRIATVLRPSLLDDIGLIAAMEWEADMFAKRTGIQVNLIKPLSVVSIPDDCATGLFRILQESLTNIARHAAASQVDIHLKNQNNEFILYIGDNGNGFDMDTVAGKKTLGLLGMKERSAMMQGVFTINSQPAKGTKLEVRVPLC